MNGKERVKLAVLDERIKTIQKIIEDKFNITHESMVQINESIKSIKGCIDSNELSINKVDKCASNIQTELNNHKSQHNRDKWMLGFFISVTAIIVSIFIRFV